MSQVPSSAPRKTADQRAARTQKRSDLLTATRGVAFGFSESFLRSGVCSVAASVGMECKSQGVAALEFAWDGLNVEAQATAKSRVCRLIQSDLNTLPLPFSPRPPLSFVADLARTLFSPFTI